MRAAVSASRRLPRSPARLGLLHRFNGRTHYGRGSMTVEDAIRELRVHFRRKAQHPHDCVCACCEAIEVLALATKGETDG